MSFGTMVHLQTANESGGEFATRFYQPWDIQNVEPWDVTADGQEFKGSRLTVSRGEDDITVYSVLPPSAIARRVDDARFAISGPSTVQPVRVTNWMAQAWVLILVQFIGNLLLYRWATRLGECLFWHVCLYDGWWLP